MKLIVLILLDTDLKVEPHQIVASMDNRILLFLNNIQNLKYYLLFEDMIQLNNYWNYSKDIVEVLPSDSHSAMMAKIGAKVTLHSNHPTNTALNSQKTVAENGLRDGSVLRFHNGMKD